MPTPPKDIPPVALYAPDVTEKQRKGVVAMLALRVDNGIDTIEEMGDTLKMLGLIPDEPTPSLRDSTGKVKASTYRALRAREEAS